VLESQGLLKLKPNAGILATAQDITANPKKLVIKELDAAVGVAFAAAPEAAPPGQNQRTTACWALGKPSGRILGPQSKSRSVGIHQTSSG
jgi:hypothetical protein